MGELFLIRHGQASYGSDDYDRLSDQGRRQAHWLGEYLLERGAIPDRVIIGTQQRHWQTIEALADAMGRSFLVELDERWNELDFQELVDAFARQHPETDPQPDPDKRFFKLMRRALLAWSEDGIEAPLRESWLQMRERVAQALAAVQSAPQHERVFVVSSSGAIAAALMQIMRFPAQTHVDLYLQARNTGFSELFFNADLLRVTAFNQTPHLDMPERRASLSFI